jgi:hypothetical protein
MPATRTRSPRVAATLDDALTGTDPGLSARATRAALARRNSGRRRFVDPTTCDRDYSAAELEFLAAIQQYKRASGRNFPTWSEVLEVARSLGYAKSAPVETQP